MEPRRLIGPPLIFVVGASVALGGPLAAALIDPGPIQIVFLAGGSVVAWRLLRSSVWLDDRLLIVRNILHTFRFDVAEIDVRARVVDPRAEFYTAGNPDVLPDLPTTSDDNTAQRAKWYELERDGDRYSIDALMGRSPPNHEQLAWRIRQEILAVRGTSG